MRDRYTWVSMRQDPADQMRDLDAATRAVQSSTKPARAVLLLRDNRSTRQYMAAHAKGAHKRVLITINRQARDLLIRDDLNRLTQGDGPTPSNPDTLMILVIIHNSQAPAYHTSHLTGLLKHMPGLKVHPAPEVRCRPPPDVQEPAPTHAAPHRHHPLLRPSQTWYRAAHHMAPHNTDECKTDEAKKSDDRSSGDKVHRVLALLGILPPGIGAAISAYWDTHELDKSALTLISNLILNKTLVLFRQDEAFRKWRKKTTAWRC
jgi:hypothetical protein